MNRDRKILYILNGLFWGILLLVLFVPNVTLTKMILAPTMAVFAAVVYIAVKKRSLLSIHKRQVAYLTPLIAFVYVTVYYLTGLYFGFYASLVRFSLETVFRHILPTVMLIVASEMIRSVFLAQKNKCVDVSSFAALVLLDAQMHAISDGMATFYGFVDTFGYVLFPAVTGNLLYHYLSRKYGSLPIILYRTVLSVYPYVIPYTPATPSAWVAFSKLITPLLVYLFLFILYEKRKYAVSRKKRKSHLAASAACLLFMIITVMLISCQFRYGLIVVGSESMTGAANKGDALIYEQYDGQIIVKGQIIIFEKDGRKIIHRVVDIERVDGELRYYTKGDANEYADTGYITESQIVGVSSARLLYIGYPTVWLRELFTKR